MCLSILATAQMIQEETVPGSGTQESARSLREGLSETGEEDEVAEEQERAFKLIEKREADVQWKSRLGIAKVRK